VKLSQSLQQDKKEFVLSKQILRSGTAIGALIREAEFGQSKADFTSKMSISLKEANETEYWLSSLKDTDFINEKQFVNLQSDCKELIAMLVSTVKTLKS
jgi:four helix bundle protein